MSPPFSECLDHQLHPDSYEHSYYDNYVPLPSENFYYGFDGVYHWSDASAARSDSCMEYSFPLYGPSLASEPFNVSAYTAYQHSDFEEHPHPATLHDHSHIFHLAQQFTSTSVRPQPQDHRSSIARASDNFLAQASSIFSDGHPPLRRGTTVDYRSPIHHQATPQRDPRPPSRKRSRESLDEGTYLVKEKDDSAHPPLPAANDARHLPQPYMIVPSQSVSSSSVRVPLLSDASTSLSSESHAREHEPRSRQEERCMVPVPKHTSNKRVHRASEELVRQENTILSMPTTWSIPDDQAVKGTKKPGEQKKQALACLFCRERKIACGRPPAHSPDQTCNQCARRRIKCEYPTESRRGQHKRRRKPVEGEPANQSSVRANPTSSVGSTTATSSSTI